MAQQKLIEIPEGWKKIDIHKDIDFLPGCPFDSDLFSENEGVPLIRIRNLLNHSTETKYTGKYSEKYVIHAGDILIGMDGDFNIVKWKGDMGVLNQRILKVMSKDPDLLDVDFFFYYIDTHLKKINDMTGQTTVKHLSVFDFDKLNLIKPKIEEQRKIALILSTLDQDIEENKMIIKKYQMMKEGMSQVNFK